LPIVRATLADERGEAVEVWLLIDYGADNTLTLPDTVLREHPGVAAVEASGGGRTRGVGGTVSNTRTWARRLTLFGMPLHDLPVNFEPPPPTLRGDRPIGRVGNQLLQHFRLTFHDRAGHVYAEWNPAPAPGN
jgi:hypothetical protein